MGVIGSEAVVALDSVPGNCASVIGDAPNAGTTPVVAQIKRNSSAEQRSLIDILSRRQYSPNSSRHL
jgi:hypothetical protein